MTGSAIAFPWEAENINAIVNAWYGGEYAGQAIADVLFGNYNPSGRLPVTFYAGDQDLPDFEDYDMSNRTYKYFKGKALYPFGYGLSYTGFACEWTKASQIVYKETESIECSVRITNTGQMDGDEIVQAYIKYPQSKAGLPLKELRFFERKHLITGRSEEIKITIPIVQLSKWSEETGGKAIPKGTYRLFVGGNSTDEAEIADFEIK
jgi:beta-glucosidase